MPCLQDLTLSSMKNCCGAEMPAKCAMDLFCQRMVQFVLAIFDTSPLVLTNHTAGFIFACVANNVADVTRSGRISKQYFLAGKQMHV